MSAKKIRMISVMMISGILLLLYLCIWQGHKTFTLLEIVVNEEGVENIRLVAQEHPLNQASELLGEEYTSLDISWQDGYKEGEKYLFLPGYVDLTDVHVKISGKGSAAEAVTFDKMQLLPDEIHPLGSLDEGAHSVSTGNGTLEFQVMKGSGLSSLWIETEKGMDYIHENRENATSGTLRIVSAFGDTEYEGEIDTLKGRGNSSWHMLKKNYGLKLTAPASLLGMSYGRGWVLCGGGDTTGLRNKILYDTAVECGLENAVESEFVDLYIDGAYYGCYLLAEKITIGFGRLEIGDLESETALMNEAPLETYPYFVMEENGKLWTGYSYPKQPANRSGGYLLEIEEYDQRFNGEPVRFTTNYGHKVVVKQPGMASLEQVTYIADFVQEFEDAIYAEDGYNGLGKSYLDYIDLESFVKRYLVDELSKSIDVGYSSYFFYKPQNESKLYAGPVWDYDTAFGNHMSWGDPEVLKDPEGMYANADNWARALWEKTEFQEAAREIFQKEFLPYLETLLETGVEEEIQRVRASMAMEQAYFGREDWEDATDWMVDFLQKRVAFLEEELR